MEHVVFYLHNDIALFRFQVLHRKAAKFYRFTELPAVQSEVSALS